MRPLKDVGIEEVRRLRRRVVRLEAMGRVFPSDSEYITDRLDEVEARIVSMHELDEYGKEVG